MVDQAPNDFGTDAQWLELAAPLPPGYAVLFDRGQAQSATTGWRPINPRDQLTRDFLREWQPLQGHLLPIEHLGEGRFACLHLAPGLDEAPVVYWDVLRDLGEQPMVVLAPTWPEYRGSRELETLDLVFVERVAQQRLEQAERELESAVKTFEEMQGRFNSAFERRHAGKSYEHSGEHPSLGTEEWRPVRFAVHDHLLGVMAYRFNGKANRIEVAGFATRDHTNYARGSATVALLTGLLCDWAAQRATEIVFFASAPSARNEQSPTMVPWEVAVLCRVLGSHTSPTSTQIDHQAAATLLVALTPLPTALRRRLRAEPKRAVLACLNVLKNIWTPLEATAIMCWCPDAEARGLFSGQLQPSEQVRYASALLHARAALLLGYAMSVIESQADEAEELTPEVDLVPDIPYAVEVRCTFPTAWLVVRNKDLVTQQIPAGERMCLIALPHPVSDAHIVRALPHEHSGLRAVLIAPSDSHAPAVLPGHACWVPMEGDVGQLDTECRTRLGRSRRLGG